MYSTTSSPTNITTTNSITALRVTEYVLFIIIFIISVVGNVLVCLVIYKTPSMRTTRNYLLVNLAVADLTVALVCIPFDVVLKVYGSPWPLGDAMCKIIWPSQTLTTMCSAATLSAISYDRYRAVLCSWKPRLSSFQTIMIIATTWLVSLILVIPYVLALQITEENTCDEKWPSTTTKQLYTTGLFLFQYALPLFLIALAYTAVVLKLRKQAANLTEGMYSKQLTSKQSTHCESNDFSSHERKSRTGNLLEMVRTSRTPTTFSKFPAINAKSEVKRIERNKKTLKMLISVVLLYAICLLPNQVAWLWIEFGSGTTFKHIENLLTFSSLLVYVNSSVNPLLYAGMNNEFRKGFRKVLVVGE